VQKLSMAQTLISRKAYHTNEVAVISGDKIKNGVRFNSIHERTEMIGTIWALD